jgi:hypothetical protein
MTTATTVLALLPVLTSSGKGADDRGLGTRDEAIDARNRVPLTEFEAKGADDGGQQKKSHAL